MGKQDKRMGSDPFSWIGEGSCLGLAKEGHSDSEAVPIKEGKQGESVREGETSSQKGLPEGWTRATFIVREDMLKRLKEYAYTDRRSIKGIVNEMLEWYLDGKESIER